MIDKIGVAQSGRAAGGRWHASARDPEDGRWPQFYRIEDGKRQYLGTDGEYHDVERAEGVLLLEDIKLSAEPLMANGSAALWDVGDGVVALEFTGKMNALDEQVMKLIQKAIPLVKKDYKALVVYNEGSNFSAGANLGLALFALNIAAWGEVEKSVKGGRMPTRR